MNSSARLRRATLILAATVAAPLLQLVSPAAAHADTRTPPTISATPGTPQSGGAAPVGASITLAGSNFGAAETLTASLNGTALATTPSPLQTAADGSFTASFTVPSLAARVYPLIVSGQTSGSQASLTFWIQAPAENILSPTSGYVSYQITDNHLREPSMQYLRITNNGDANLVSPRLLPDSLTGQDPFVDTSSLASIVNGIFAANPQAVTDAQRAYVLWDWITNYSYHYYDAQNPDPVLQADVVGLLNNYGYLRCWNISRILEDMYQFAGYQSRGMNFTLHAAPEVNYGGGWHEYDPDQRKVYFGADGSVLGTQALVANPHAVFQNVTPGGSTKFFSYFRYTPTYLANLYATTGDNKSLGNVYPPVAHDMTVTLRKHETLIQNWTNVGKFHDNYLHQVAPNVYTNGGFLYQPDLSEPNYSNGVFGQSDVASVSQDGLRPNLHAQSVGTFTSVEYQVHSPWTLVGSLLSAQVYRATANDEFNILFSLDGNNWSPVYSESKTGYDNPQLDFSNLLNNGTLPEEYTYYVMFQWTANANVNDAGLDSFSLNSQFEQALQAIPPLHSGVTNLTYRDASAVAHAPGDVQVAYGWKPEGAPTDLAKSSLTTDFASVPADGNGFADVQLQLQTSAGAGIPQYFVGLSPNQGASVQIRRAYQYQSLRGVTDGKGKAVWEVRASQPGTVSFTAVDKNGLSLGIAPITVTFTAPSAPPTLSASEGTQFVNGGFETGDFTGWTTGGATAPSIETTAVASGTAAAQLGSPAQINLARDSNVFETLTVPSTASNLTLSYLLSNPSAATGNFLEIWVRDTATDRLNKLFSSSSDTGGTFKAQSYSISAYRGNTIQIFVNMHQGGSSNAAYADIDSLSIG